MSLSLDLKELEHMEWLARQELNIRPPARLTLTVSGEVFFDGDVPDWFAQKIRQRAKEAGMIEVNPVPLPDPLPPPADEGDRDR